MYQTHPKSALCIIAAMLTAAFALPIWVQFPSIGETAAGLNIALLLLTMFIIHLILQPETTPSWAGMLRAPLVIIAAGVALGYAPQDDFSDVARRAGMFALFAGLGTGIAFLNPKARPKRLGPDDKTAIWIVPIAIICMLVWHHMFRFAGAQGAALVNDLIVLAAFANVVSTGQMGMNGLSALQKWTVRILVSISFVIYIGTICWPVFDPSAAAFDPMANIWVNGAAMAVMAILSPWLDRIGAKSG